MGRLRQTTEEIQNILDEAEGLRPKVVQNADAIATLNGDGDGSVESRAEKKIKDNTDSALSTTSENPVQNKVVTEELGRKVEGYFALTETIDNPMDYVDGMGETISIPLEADENSEIRIYVLLPLADGSEYLLLNKANDFYDNAWDDTDDYFYHAKYSEGILLLEETNNITPNHFSKVEVYSVRSIDETLIPNTIARTEDVNAINAEQNERISELREETTALWGDMENKVDHSDLATINGQLTQLEQEKQVLVSRIQELESIIDELTIKVD